MSDPISAFSAALVVAAIPASNKPIRVSSKIERFTPEGDHQENGWYVLYNLTHAVVGAYGCWKRNVSLKFCSADKSSLTSQQWNEVSKAWKEAEGARAAETLRLQTEAREKCKKLFTQTGLTKHGYLDRKNVKAHKGIVSSNLITYPGWLAIPLQDATGTIQSAQLIDADGTKKFLFGGKVAGCWFPLALNLDGPLCIVEGYATGASVHEATGWAVVCAMNAGNLPAVAAAIRKLFPDRTIIIAADNDQWTEGNPGFAKAQAAAKAAKATVVGPVFADESEGKPTDFNDLHRLAGVGEVKRQLLAGAKMGGDWEMLVEDICDTMTEVIPDPTEIVAGLAAEGSKVVVGGGSKTYKTWWMIDMALSVAAGGKFLGRQCLRRRVLYVNFELRQTGFKRRLQTVCHAKGIHPDYKQFHHISLRGLIARVPPNVIVDKIVAITKRLQCELVVVDPLYKLNTQGKDENSSGDMGVLLNELDRVTTEANVTLFFADHFGKGNQSEKDPLDTIRGSSTKGGDVDAAIILRPHKEKGSYSVDVVHRELAPIEPFVVTWQYPLFHSDDQLDAADMKKPRGGRPKLVEPVTVLYAFEGTSPDAGTSISEVSRKIGMARSTLQGHTQILRARGWIATSGEGSDATQFITPLGTQRLELDKKTPPV